MRHEKWMTTKENARNCRLFFLCLLTLAVFFSAAGNGHALTLEYVDGNVSALHGESYDITFVQSSLRYDIDKGWLTDQVDSDAFFSGAIIEGLGFGAGIASALGIGPRGAAPDPVKGIIDDTGTTGRRFIVNYFNTELGAWEFEEYWNDGVRYIAEGQIQLGEFYPDHNAMLANPWCSGCSSSTVTLALMTGAKQPVPIPEPGTLVLMLSGLVCCCGRFCVRGSRNPVE